jgi:hypothetical protein
MYGRQTYINSIKSYCLLFNYASLLGEMGFVQVEYWKFRRFSSQNCELVWFLAIEAEADCIRLLRWEVSQLEEDLRYPRGPAVAGSWCHNCVLDKYRQHIVSKFCDALCLFFWENTQISFRHISTYVEVPDLNRCTRSTTVVFQGIWQCPWCARSTGLSAALCTWNGACC